MFFASPTPDSVTSWVEAMKSVWQLIASIGVGLGGAWLWVANYRRRMERERREREQRQAQSRRVLAARERYHRACDEMTRTIALTTYGPQETRLTERDERERAAIQLHEIQEARAALWVVEGRPDPLLDPEGAERARELLRAMTITQRFYPPSRGEEDGPA